MSLNNDKSNVIKSYLQFLKVNSNMKYKLETGQITANMQHFGLHNMLQENILEVSSFYEKYYFNC
jgi:hypothetical protein